MDPIFGESGESVEGLAAERVQLTKIAQKEQWKDEDQEKPAWVRYHPKTVVLKTEFVGKARKKADKAVTVAKSSSGVTKVKKIRQSSFSNSKEVSKTKKTATAKDNRMAAAATAAAQSGSIVRRRRKANMEETEMLLSFSGLA